MNTKDQPTDDIQKELVALFTKALAALTSDTVNFQLVRSKNANHGDFACNAALVLAKKLGQNPRQLAQALIDALPSSSLMGRCEVAGAGFVNVFLNQAAKFAVLDTILTQKDRFGCCDSNHGRRVQIEFVSANPTSALHVGHGRGAAYGATLGNLLAATGYEVQREYYVNDAGRQMDILAVSTLVRYLQHFGVDAVLPSGGYQGDYVKDIANTLADEYQDRFVAVLGSLYDNVPKDEEDKEAHLDGLIDNAKTLLGDDYGVFHGRALAVISADIKDDLAEFGVVFDEWFSEKSLQANVEKDLQLLDEKGFLYQKEGNIWFKSTQFGDEKDRVVKRANGQTTYFASDISYHKNKFERGFDTVINVWGADHHGYIARVKAALSAFGIDPKRLEVPLVQFVSLYRGEQKVAMSSRSGQFISLRELRDEVGNDAARFYYVSRTPNVPMDFDLALAKSQSRDNAVYYIQYAHARICRLFERATTLTLPDTPPDLSLLDHSDENTLVKRLSAYPDTVLKAAQTREPHLLTNYLKELAGELHGFYNDQRILPAEGEACDLALVQARLHLLKAVAQVLVNGLSLLGLSAPTSM